MMRPRGDLDKNSFESKDQNFRSLQTGGLKRKTSKLRLNTIRRGPVGTSSDIASKSGFFANLFEC
jgi:hypothetical protein